LSSEVELPWQARVDDAGADARQQGAHLRTDGVGVAEFGREVLVLARVAGAQGQVDRRGQVDDVVGEQRRALAGLAIDRAVVAEVG
jgi:hypothetical protein